MERMDAWKIKDFTMLHDSRKGLITPIPRVDIIIMVPWNSDNSIQYMFCCNHIIFFSLIESNNL